MLDFIICRLYLLYISVLILTDYIYTRKLVSEDILLYNPELRLSPSTRRPRRSGRGTGASTCRRPRFRRRAAEKEARQSAPAALRRVDSPGQPWKCPPVSGSACQLSPDWQPPEVPGASGRKQPPATGSSYPGSPGERARRGAAREERRS